MKEENKIHFLWLAFCMFLGSLCLEFSYTVYPFELGVLEPITKYHPAIFPIEGLLVIGCVWLIGHLVIWNYWRGRNYE